MRAFFANSFLEFYQEIEERMSKLILALAAAALGTLWGHSGDALGHSGLWGRFGTFRGRSGDALGRSGDAVGHSGDALGTETLWDADALGRSGDTLGRSGTMMLMMMIRLPFLYIQTPDQPPKRPLC